MKRRSVYVIFPVLVLLLPMLSARGQETSVYAEAIQQANLRAGIGVETEVVGQISVGTRYPVIGRSEFFPWLLLGTLEDAAPLGWVFAELVTVYGSLNAVPFSTLDVSIPPTPTFTPTPDPALVASPGGPTLTVPAISPTPTLRPGVYGLFSGEVNLRYGPGVSYERVGVAQAGERYPIVGYHTQFEWVQIAYPDAPLGAAWVAQSLIEIEGDLFTTRPIAMTDFSGLPTLTPTAAVLSSSDVFRQETAVPVSGEFMALGSRLWNLVLESGFDPATSRFGALYLRDMQTGEEITFGNGFAFSGTSINKVAILLELFDRLNDVPNPNLATDIANTMICSENTATNNLLSFIGGGDLYLGAESVSSFMTQLGLTRSFITAPYSIPDATPVPPSAPIRLPQTQADQAKANADLTNQMTVDDVGYMLSALYQCGMQESGPLLTQFEGFTPQECRKALHVMANNTTDALLKAGVPADVAVAHKHGWIEDTHGNAAVMFTPGGDYVLVMMLHQPEWLNYQESLPVIAEVSRQIYNYYNPDAPLDEIREGYIPPANECNFQGTPLVTDLISPFYAEALPFDPLPLGGS